MDKQTMIDKIYEVVADKTLSMWCYYFSEITRQQEVYDWSIWSNYIRKIIGHPVMIWDVLDFIDDWDFANMASQIYQQDRIKIDDPDEDNITSIITILDLRKEKRKPIEEQSEHCIKYIYNLLSEK